MNSEYVLFSGAVILQPLEIKLPTHGILRNIIKMPLGELYDYQKRRYKFCTICPSKKIPIKDKFNKFREVIKLYAYSDNYCSQCGHILIGERKKTCYTAKAKLAQADKHIATWNPL